MQTFKPSEVIPLGLVKLETQEELELLGIAGIEQLIRYWRGVYKQLGELMKLVEPGFTLKDVPDYVVQQNEMKRFEFSIQLFNDRLAELSGTSRATTSLCRGERNAIERKIEWLDCVKKQAPKAPLLPQLRPRSSWFAEGERVVVLKGPDSFHKVTTTGYVLPRHLEIMVLVRPQDADPNDHKKVLTINYMDLTLMHDWEWHLFSDDVKNGINFLEFWKKHAAHNPQFYKFS